MRMTTTIAALTLLATSFFWACSAPQIDDAFERTKAEVQQADERLFSLAMELETGHDSLACGAARALRERMRKDTARICEAAKEYPDYPSFATRCQSGRAEVRSSGTTVERICSGTAPDDVI